MRYRSSSKKESKKISEKNSSIFVRKTKASYLMTEVFLVQKVAHIHAVFLERKWFLHLLSVLSNEQRMRIFFSTFFSTLFCPKKTSMKKRLTSFLGQNVVYETRVQFTKPWTLYLVSVLRYSGSNMKNCQKSVKKNHEGEFFSNVFFSAKM